MAKRSTSDEITLEEIMQKSLKDMGKGETVEEENATKQPVETPSAEPAKPQFGFKLNPIEAVDSFVVSPKKESNPKEVKEQVILEKPSQDLDDDIIVEW